MNKTYIWGLALLVVAFFAVTAVPGIQLGQVQGVNYMSSVCVYKNNELIDCSSNLLYDDGKNLIRTVLGNTGTGGPVKNITLCNATAGCGSPQADHLETYNYYTSCGLQADADGSYGALGQAGNWTISRLFTASCDGLVTNATRLEAGSATIFAGNNFTSVTLQTNDQINVTWTIWVT